MLACMLARSRWSCAAGAATPRALPLTLCAAHVLAWVSDDCLRRAAAWQPLQPHCAAGAPAGHAGRGRRSSCSGPHDLGSSRWRRREQRHNRRIADADSRGRAGGHPSAGTAQSTGHRHRHLPPGRSARADYRRLWACIRGSGAGGHLRRSGASGQPLLDRRRWEGVVGSAAAVIRLAVERSLRSRAAHLGAWAGRTTKGDFSQGAPGSPSKRSPRDDVLSAWMASHEHKRSELPPEPGAIILAPAHRLPRTLPAQLFHPGAVLLGAFKTKQSRTRKNESVSFSIQKGQIQFTRIKFKFWIAVATAKANYHSCIAPQGYFENWNTSTNPPSRKLGTPASCPASVHPIMPSGADIDGLGNRRDYGVGSGTSTVQHHRAVWRFFIKADIGWSY